MSGIGHGVYFSAGALLMSYIKDHENSVSLEKNTPLKFPPPVSRLVSTVVVNPLDIIINGAQLFRVRKKRDILKLLCDLFLFSVAYLELHCLISEYFRASLLLFKN